MTNNNMAHNNITHPKMTHPKMKFTYVGIDSHKETHTAVFLDCFFDKLGEITFGNRLKDFDSFLTDAQNFKLNGTEFLFGLEDTSKYGRLLTKFLMSNGQTVKHVNAYLVAGERKNLGFEKSDSTDAQCAARILISKFQALPETEEDERYHILRTLVVRRDFLVRGKTALKSYLHSLLTIDFPNYHKFFSQLDGKTALEFFTKYPSPNMLNNTTVEELSQFLWNHSGGLLEMERAKEILSTIDTATTPVHEVRNNTVLSAIRQLQYNMQELEIIETDLYKVYKQFNTTLTSMTGLDLVSASKMLSCIGDIRKFATPAKLAKYAGVAPVSHSSGKRDIQFASTRGDRELNSLFYNLAVRMITTYEPGHKAINSFFHEYYHKKLSEGKTKRQALKCVQRRLVNIIWTMLTNNEDYVNPPMIGVKKTETL